MTRTFAACSTRGSDLRLRLLFAAALFFASLFAPAVARAEDACSGAATKHVYAPSADTLLALAICHEAHDKTASAWAEYEEAATLARRAKNAALAKVARKHAASVERRLAKLAVTVSGEADTPSLVVTRDGIVLERAAWASEIPVDPGEHVVEAIADGKTRFVRTVLVRREGATETVAIGPLADAPDDVPVSTTTLSSATLDAPADAGASRGTAQRVIGLVTLGAGIGALGAGAYFGIDALERRDAARAACPASPCSDPAGVDDNQRAREAATLSTIGLVAGGAAAVVGTLLFFTAPSRSPRVGFTAGPGYAGVGISGGL